MGLKQNLKVKYIFKNPWLKLREDSFTFDGKEMKYSVVERPDSVVIIPLTEHKRTILLEQFRPPIDSYTWELPMGGIDDHETEEQAVVRELMEETKIQAGKMDRIGEYYSANGLSPQKVAVYITRVTDRDLEKAQPSTGEGIKNVKILSIDEVYEMVKQGEIKDGFTLVALLFLKQYLP